MARKAPNLANKSGSGSSSAKARSTPAIRENLGARHRRETDELFRTRLLTAAMFGAILSPLFGVVDVHARCGQHGCGARARVVFVGDRHQLAWNCVVVREPRHRACPQHGRHAVGQRAFELERFDVLAQGVGARAAARGRP